ncbi:MAG: rRNA maturation RNase YbeY [Actinobacteria bacterium]|nr:rRNA maturation RNase YbeY [Actinomycetota bacterium]
MSTNGPAPGAAATDIELIGSDDDALTGAAAATLARLGVTRGHIAIEIVDATRIRQLNREYRDKDSPTDVLSFPVDAEGVAQGELPVSGHDDAPVELGDVVICPEHTQDMIEATVHGVLHLCGFDHETDDGEMLALQDEIVDSLEKRAGA